MAFLVEWDHEFLGGKDIGSFSSEYDRNERGSYDDQPC